MPVMVLDPNLCAGWEPDSPVEDSLLQRFLVNWTASISGPRIWNDFWTSAYQAIDD